MPIFECSQCSDLTYASSTAHAARCLECGGRRRVAASDPAAFAAAKEVPRVASHGDHSVAVFDDFEQVAGIARQFVDAGKAAGALVIAGVPFALERRILERLDESGHLGIFWEPPSDMFGPTFSPEEVTGRLREIVELEGRPVYVLTCADEPIQHFTSKQGWIEFEHAAHALTAEHDLTVLGLYDARIHDDAMLRAGLRTHELDGEERVSRDREFDYGP